MNARIEALRQAPWKEWTGQTWAVALYELRRLQRGKHAVGRVGLVCVPIVFAVLAAVILSGIADRAFVEPLIINGTRRTAGAELLDLARLFRFLNLPFVVYVAASSLFGNLYHAEIADRTLHHVFLMPVRREVITLGKYAAGTVTVFVSTLVAWLITGGVLLSIHGTRAAAGVLFSAEGIRHVVAYAAMLLLAVLAYGALFLLVGALVKAPSMVAGGLLAWEWLTLFLPTSFKQFTVIHWVASFLPASVTTESMFATLAEPESRVLATAVLLLFAAACVALATWRARRIQISYGASE